MRGSKRFDDIFSETLSAKKQKGRNSDLLAKRNDCLLDRYFYYGKFFGLRYDLIIQKLSEEFCLSSSTLQQIIESNLSLVSEKKKAYNEDDEPNIKKQFKEKWPHMVWH